MEIWLVNVMNLMNFPFLNQEPIIFTTSEDFSHLKIGELITLIPYMDDEYFIDVNGKKILVEGKKTDRKLLYSLTHRNETEWLYCSVNNQQLYLMYCSPVEKKELNLEIAVDDYIADILYTRQEISQNDISEACKWLAEIFLVELPNTTRWLSIKRFSNTKNNSFQMLGQKWVATVSQSQKNYFIITNLTKSTKNDMAFSLLVGDFNFENHKNISHELTEKANNALQVVLQDNGSYLELWNLYNDKQWEIAVEEAYKLNTLHFISCEGFEDGRYNRWRLIPKNNEAFLDFKHTWHELNIDSSAMVDLSDEPKDWNKEIEALDEESHNVKSRGKIRFSDNYIIFTPDSSGRHNDPSFPKGGWLYLSLAGQKTIGKRRKDAKQNIDSGKKLPQLRMLLEGVSPAEYGGRRVKPIQGITPYALESFKGGQPTEKQKLALNIALNTQDLALIIGPPGTGKTQVIAALQRRLAEIAEENNVSSQVLISSFQHDAVDNALERSNVFNLPGIRVGGRKGGNEQENNFTFWIDQQVHHLKNKINQEYERNPELLLIKEIQKKLVLLRVGQSSLQQLVQELSILLEGLREISRLKLSLSFSLISQLEDYLGELSNKQKSQVELQSSQPSMSTIRYLRALRTTENSFLDDGSARAYDLYIWLKSQQYQVEVDDLNLLDHASNQLTPSKDLLEKLQGLHDRLLTRFLPPYVPTRFKNHLDRRGKRLLQAIDDNLTNQLGKTKLAKASILEQLFNHLQTDHSSALRTIEDYSMVVGATCQQAASKKMADIKSLSGSDTSDISFDTVIIDEAARANPLDLFIPMSMASKRVILVGDDRQLPHMLEPEVEAKLQDEHELSILQREAFKLSLFERLRIKLQDLQKSDNKTRVIMLDTQFRMHPILGDFISQQFYEPLNLGKVYSGRPADDFEFDAAFLTKLNELRKFYENKVCQWIAVPPSCGTSKRLGTSLVRECEAEIIANEVKKILEAGDGKISIGVISFYSAQCDLILQKLASENINGIPITHKKNGIYEISDEFKSVVKQKKDGSYYKEEGLRVGTVDAFQGKEFDIVLLSCVRTLPSSKHLSRLMAGSVITDVDDMNEIEESILNRIFGFLRLPNRMNVAMSRQKQMLICVGDNTLVEHAEAKRAIPALSNFYKLCGGDHGSIR